MVIGAEMAIAVTHDEPRPGQILGQPQSPRGRHDAVVAAVSQQNRAVDGAQVEIPFPAAAPPASSPQTLPRFAGRASSLSRDDSRFRSSKAATTRGPPDTRNTSASGS